MHVEQVIEQLRALGVTDGAVLLVHTSFRSVRPVDGGPLGLIEALQRAVGMNGTLVMPTMTDGETVFDPKRTPTVNMGIVAETFWRQPGVLRSTHPGGSFAARGPDAPRICAPQPLSPPHGHDSPVGRVFDLDGWVLMLGIGHSENTTLHLAEALARVPYSVTHPTVVSIDGRVQTVDIAETDHCCRGFNQVDGWLDAAQLQRRGTVGHAQARLVGSRALLETVVPHLRAEPLLFLCPKKAACDECDAARQSAYH